MTDVQADFPVEQTVHGYQRGHRLLASSMELSETGAGAMLGMSDLLGEPVARDSYLTCYPLRGVNRVVLARTWLAPEMPRPGCVWTHSLLLDYVSVGRLANPERLLNLHRRPSLDSLTSFKRPLSLKVTEDSHDIGLLHHDRLQAALTAIYTGGGNAFGHGWDDAEPCALAIWRQMWPRLRRSFFFCTATVSPLIVEGAEASFQNLLEWQSRWKVPQSRPISAPETEGVEILVEDGMRPGPTDLRRFLSRFAPGLPDQLAAAPRLAVIYDRLSSARTEKEIAGAAAVIASSFPDREAAPLKADLLMGRFRGELAVPDQLGRDFRGALSAFVKQPAFVDRTELSHHLRALHQRGAFDPKAVLRLSAASRPGSLGRLVLDILATDLSDEVDAATLDSETRRALAVANPSLLGEPAFWPSDPSDRAALLGLALRKRRPVRLLDMLLETLSGQEAAMLIEHGGAPVLHRLMEAWPERPSLRSSMPAWRHFFFLFPEELTATLDRLQQRPALLEEFVKGLLETEIEDALSDVIVARLVKGLQESRADLPAICTLAFVRGVQAESVSSGLLIEFSFDVLIDRIKMGTLPATCERMLQRRLSAFGFRYPPALDARMLEAVAERFLDGRRPLPWILKVSDDHARQVELLTIISRRFVGGRLLRSLFEDYRKSRSVPKGRIGLLEDILWPYGRSKKKR